MNSRDKMFHLFLAMRIALFLVFLLYHLSLSGAVEGREEKPLRIAYPPPGQVVNHDWIPVWIRSAAPGAFDEMSVRLNGNDITGRFTPWGGRLNDDPEALALVRPRQGWNRIEVTVPSVDRGATVVATDFRFEPYPLRVRVRILEGNRRIPARVAFVGMDGTPDPLLAPPIWDSIRHGSRDRRGNFVFSESGEVELHLPEGRYEVFASRGPAYSLARGEVDGESTKITLNLTRVLDTSGWISADFHVHAIPSGDSSIPLWDRVVSFLAQDVDVIVASDHNTITDYGADLGPDHHLPHDFAAIPGVESRIHQRGHWNFWPLVRDHPEDNVRPWTPGNMRSYGGFAPEDAQHPSDLFRYFGDLLASRRRMRFGDFPILIQLNHPRGIQFLPLERERKIHDYFNRIGFDPAKPLAADSNGELLSATKPGDLRPVDIDAIELLNRLAFGLYLKVRTDWFAWIRQGFIPTATANSDTHGLFFTEAGFPRNWIRYRGPLPVDAQSLVRAVRARQLVGSTGPLVTLHPWPEDGRPIRGPMESLTVTVRSVAWIPVEELRVYINGVLTHTREIKTEPVDPFSARERVHRFEIPVRIRNDAFVVVEAGDRIPGLLSDEPRSGPFGRAFPFVRVLAFTNPLLIDVEGDGTIWDQSLDRAGIRADSPVPPQGSVGNGNEEAASLLGRRRAR